MKTITDMSSFLDELRAGNHAALQQRVDELRSEMSFSLTTLNRRLAGADGVPALVGKAASDAMEELSKPNTDTKLKIQSVVRDMTLMVQGMEGSLVNDATVREHTKRIILCLLRIAETSLAPEVRTGVITLAVEAKNRLQFGT